MSSSRPGPSPTKTTSACALPLPKTILLRCWQRRQRLQSPMSSLMRESESFSMRWLASKSDADFMTGEGAADGAAEDWSFARIAATLAGVWTDAEFGIGGFAAEVEMVRAALPVTALARSR